MVRAEITQWAFRPSPALRPDTWSSGQAYDYREIKTSRASRLDAPPCLPDGRQGRGASLCILGFFNDVEKGLDLCLGRRGQKALQFVNREMIVQKLNDIRPELPARDDSSAGKSIVDGTAVSKRNFTPELGTVHRQ